MRVAVIFDNFGPYHIARLAAAAQRIDVTGIELANRSDDYAWERPEGEAAFDRVTLFPTGTSGQRMTREIGAAMVAALERARPDVVAIPGWSDRGGLVALRWARRNGVPVVVMSESNDIDRRRSRLREAVKRRIVSLCSTGLVGGARSAKYLASLGMEQSHIFVGYDIVDNDYFALGAAAVQADAAAVRAQYALPAQYFLTCCRFLPKKNLEFLIDAYAVYRRTHGAAAWHLVLLGDGVMRASLERKIAALGLDGAVHLPGFAQYAQLPAYYGLAGAFVLASTVEQWGLVVNEAMASGLPVLVSDRCGSAGSLVEDGVNGFRFSPTDQDALVRGLDAIAHGGDAAAMGRESTRIIADWAPERFAESLQQAADCALSLPAPKPGWSARLALRMMIG